MAVGKITACVTVLAVLPTACLCARLSVKRVRSSPWAPDDTLLVLALIFLYTAIATIIVSMEVGQLGQHVQTATKPELEKTFFIAWLFPSLMAVELALTRCAVSIFFLRILYTKVTPWLRYAAHLCIALSTASVVATFIVQFLHCRRFSLNWGFPLWKHADCFDIKPCLITLVAVSIGVDVVTWTTPHLVVWGLQLRRAHKIAITAIFAIGVTTIIIGAIRVANIAKFAPDGDLTYNLPTQLLLNLTQMSVGIVVACLPHMRPVFEKVIPRRFTRISGNSSNGKGPTPGTRSISATTTIEVSDTLPYYIWSAPRSHLAFCNSTHNKRTRSVILDPSHDGQGDPWAPTFDVVQTPAVPRQHRSLHRRQGPPRDVDWYCLRSERPS